jgi:hypothetical protein
MHATLVGRRRSPGTRPRTPEAPGRTYSQPPALESAATCRGRGIGLTGASSGRTADRAGLSVGASGGDRHRREHGGARVGVRAASRRPRRLRRRPRWQRRPGRHRRDRRRAWQQGRRPRRSARRRPRRSHHADRCGDLPGLVHAARLPEDRQTRPSSPCDRARSPSRSTPPPCSPFRSRIPRVAPVCGYASPAPIRRWPACPPRSRSRSRSSAPPWSSPGSTSAGPSRSPPRSTNLGVRGRHGGR